MCGLVGYIGLPTNGLLLRAACIEASRRGAHSYGVEVHGNSPVLIKESIALHPTGTRRIMTIADSQTAPFWLIAQARLATSGTFLASQNNQPLRNNNLGVSVVHNGNVYNSQAVFNELAYKPITGNDSEAVLAIACKHKDDFESMAANIKRMVASSSPLACIVGTDAGILAISRGHPLFYLATADGMYFCSRPIAGALKLNDFTVRRLNE